MDENHPLVRHYMCFGLVYFLYDIYSMFLVFRATQQEKGADGSFARMCRVRWIMVVHHLALPLIG